MTNLLPQLLVQRRHEARKHLALTVRLAGQEPRVQIGVDRQLQAGQAGEGGHGAAAGGGEGVDVGAGGHDKGSLMPRPLKNARNMSTG